MARDEGDRELVEGLIKGLAVISAFDESSPRMTLAQVARKTGYTPAATRRSLFTLARLGYVRQSDRDFLLTPQVLLLGSAYLRSAHVGDALVPILREVVEQFGDEASIGVLSGDRVLYVAHVADPGKSRPFAGTGVTQPAYLTSMGHVLLGTLAEDALSNYLSKVVMTPVTDATLTDPMVLKATIEQVRGNGFAVAIDQIAYGVTAIAVPIKLASGATIAAMNSSGYTGRLTTEELLQKRLPFLREASRKVTEILDGFPILKESLVRGGW